jgi:DNA-binding transcriptional LysR family regulator
MVMQDLQIDWLRAFVAIVDGGSLSSAAKIIHRSQAAVSMQLKKLEHASGAALLIRDARRLALTPEGRQLLPYARRIIATQQEARAALCEPSVSGHVRLGIPDDYAVSYLAPVLRTFSAQYPEIEITLICTQSTSLLPQIHANELDVALVSQERPGQGTVLFHEPLVWVGSPTVETWRDDPLPIAIYEEGSVVRRVTETALDAQKRRYRLAYHSPSLIGQIAAAQSGLAVAVLTRCSVPDFLQLLGSRHGLPALPPTPVALVASQAAENSEAARHLQQQIVATLARETVSGRP